MPSGEDQDGLEEFCDNNETDLAINCAMSAVFSATTTSRHGDWAPKSARLFAAAARISSHVFKSAKDLAFEANSFASSPETAISSTSPSQSMTDFFMPCSSSTA